MNNLKAVIVDMTSGAIVYEMQVMRINVSLPHQRISFFDDGPCAEFFVPSYIEIDCYGISISTENIGRLMENAYPADRISTPSVSGGDRPC